MIKNLLNCSVKQGYFPSTNQSISEISKADSLIKKIIKIVKFIILIPGLVIYDLSHHLSNLFKRDVKKVSLLDRFFSSFTESKVTIIKTVLAGTSLFGIIHYALKKLPNQQDPRPLLSNKSWVLLATTILGAVFCKKGVEDARKKFESYNDKTNTTPEDLKIIRKLNAISSAKSVVDVSNEEKRNDNLQLMSKAQDAIDSLKDSLKNGDFEEYSFMEMFFAIIALNLDKNQIGKISAKIKENT